MNATVPIYDRYEEISLANMWNVGMSKCLLLRLIFHVILSCDLEQREYAFLYVILSSIVTNLALRI
jgi:hypothetical protein